MLNLLFAAVLVCSQGAAAPASSDLVAAQLRCEYLMEPAGIDAASPRLSWVLESETRGRAQSAYRIRVASTAELLAGGGADLWDSGKVASSEQNQVAYAGAALASHQRCYWAVQVWDESGAAGAWSGASQWTMGVVKPEDWRASWIAAPEGVAEDVNASGPLPLFRREFQLAKPVKRALFYACGLGFQEVRLNGAKVGDAVYEPGWTNYRKTCLYSATDVTLQLREKDNVLGVMLGNGMYNVPGGRYVKFKGTFGPPKVIALLHIEYADGSSEDVGTDASWRAARGPIVFSCMYGGEDYDAREEQAGWDAPGFDASSWKAAAAVEGPGGKLSSVTAPPIKVMQTYAPARITKIAPGKYIYDLGKNFSGRPSIKVQGARGATVKLIPGELLDDKGLVTQRSSGGPMYFSYVLKGEGVEAWQPRFCYYGFRYLQVEGGRIASDADEGLPQLVEVAGEFTHSSAEVVGSFECANPIVNDVHALILQSIRSNLQSVLTDCPHREKLGWLEVSHLLADGLMYNFDLARFYAKIEQDMADSQLDNGLIPDIAPEYTVFQHGFRDSPEWGTAGVVNPWNAWLVYGDRGIIERHYDVMRRYVEYLGSTAKDHIVSHGLGDWYDIGPGGPGESKLTSKGVTATAVYYQDLCALRDAALLLGKKDEAEKIAALAADVRGAFNAAFYHADAKSYDRNSQTANAMPLVLGLVDDANRDAVSQTLAGCIRADNYHVTAGDVGFSYVVGALTGAEQGGLLYKMVCQTDGPGYVYQLQHGATSLTEAWDTNPSSSQNHCMLGHAENWFYRGLGGIRVDTVSAGFRHFVLRPQFPEGLEWVKASYRSVRGVIGSEWRLGAGAGTWSVRIPPNASATVFVPVGSVDAVTEGGKALEKVEGISEVRVASGAVVFEAKAGVYRFAWKQ